MKLPIWREEPIVREQDRRSFDCCEPAMNDFLQRYARQSHEQNASKTFCAIDEAAPKRILDFYTIAPTSVDYDAVPAAMLRGLAQHEVPGFRLARLATDLSVVGKGLGGQLLSAAALRCLRIADKTGGRLLVIDAKSERAARWYAGFGAEALEDRPLTLELPLATFADDLRARGLLL